MNYNTKLRQIEELLDDKEFEQQAIKNLKFGDDGYALTILINELNYLLLKNIEEKTLFTFLYHIEYILNKGKEYQKVRREKPLILPTFGFPPPPYKRE